MSNLVDVLFRPPAHVTNPDRLVEVPSARTLSDTVVCDVRCSR